VTSEHFDVLVVGAGISGICAAVLAPDKASDLRTLTNTGAICPGTSSAQAVDQQQNPDGTIAPFSIPAGSVLVITSYSFAISTSPGSTENVGLLATNGTTVSGLTQCFAVTDAADMQVHHAQRPLASQSKVDPRRVCLAPPACS